MPTEMFIPSGAYPYLSKQKANSFSLTKFCWIMLKNTGVTPFTDTDVNAMPRTPSYLALIKNTLGW